MTAGHGNGVNRFLPELIGELPQLTGFKAPEVRWAVNDIKQRGLGRNGHATLRDYPA
jgi:hypothetical protein